MNKEVYVCAFLILIWSFATNESNFFKTQTQSLYSIRTCTKYTPERLSWVGSKILALSPLPRGQAVKRGGDSKSGQSNAISRAACMVACLSDDTCKKIGISSKDIIQVEYSAFLTFITGSALDASPSASRLRGSSSDAPCSTSPCAWCVRLQRTSVPAHAPRTVRAGTEPSSRHSSSLHRIEVGQDAEHRCRAA